MQAIVVAGGRGIRLDPLTRVLPKPLLPVGDEPIAAILLRQLRQAGVDEVIMCLGHLGDLIKAYFQDGGRFGLSIRYMQETAPLGTAGPLAGIIDLAEDFLVVNGDEFTTLDFQAMFQYHIAHHADMTIAVQKKELVSAFGVLEVKKGRIVAYREKPKFDYWASMGIYVLNRRVVDFLQTGRRSDIPELVQTLLLHDARILSYYSQDMWLDIGTRDDLEKAQQAAVALGVCPRAVDDGVDNDRAEGCSGSNGLSRQELSVDASGVAGNGCKRKGGEARADAQSQCADSYL